MSRRDLDENIQRKRLTLKEDSLPAKNNTYKFANELIKIMLKSHFKIFGASHRKHNIFQKVLCQMSPMLTDF